MLTKACRAIVMAALAAAVAAGCGDDSDGTQKEIAEVVESLQRDFQTGDVTAICRATTRDVHRQLDAAGHGTPAPCPDSLDRVLLMIEEGLIASKTPTVEEVTVDGDQAIAVLGGDGSSTVSVPFERDGGRWRMSNFFGVAALPEAEPQSRAIFRTAPAQPVGTTGTALAVDRAGDPCPGLTGRPAPARDGCRIRLAGKQRFRVRTALGSFPLGNCTFDGTLQVASDGRVALHDIGVHGPSPCNDLQGCAVRRFERTPWNGQLRQESATQLNGRLEACLDTCVGRFVGPVAFTVKKEALGWRMSFDDAPVGAGSLTLTGSTPLAGLERLDFRAG